VPCGTTATLWLHYNYVLVRLYEPATWPSATANASSTTASSSLFASEAQQQQQQHHAFLRSQCLLYCLQAAKAFLTVLLSSPAGGGAASSSSSSSASSLSGSTPEHLLLARPFVVAAELVHVLVTASRLLLLRADHWDLGLARQTLDLLAALDQLTALFARASLLQRQRAHDAAAATAVSVMGLAAAAAAAVHHHPHPPHQHHVSHHKVAAGVVAPGVVVVGAPLSEDGDSPDDKKHDVFAKYGEKIKWIRVWFHSRLAAQANAALPPEFQQPLPPPPDDLVLPEEIWGPGENTGNQFLLGLIGGSNWNMFDY
jgi:hypothetical protein